MKCDHAASCCCFLLLPDLVFTLQFNRGKIPERVVHARGMSAKGYFEVGSGNSVLP